MSHHKLRDNKTCQNCSHFVSERFCPNCGQENTETRQPFHYLFKHFAEDLVHYDGKFWQTIKYLVFFPGKLTNEYLEGKRKRHVAPVKLYIFISFLTFFIPFILPNFNANNKTGEQKEIIKINTDKNTQVDLLGTPISLFGLKKIRSVNHLDSIQQSSVDEKKLSYFKYMTFKKILQKKEDYIKMSSTELKEKFAGAFTHNLPKVLFIYMPFFAITLWFFHSRKKWYYFDHGIFTLHFFSFMLLITLLFILTDWLLYSLLGESSLYDTLINYIITLFILYPVFYFFRSHHRVYKESKWVSRLKGFFIFFGNQFIILFILISYFIYIALTVH